MKRIVLFVFTNILILAMVSIVTSVLGIQPYLSERGINYSSLLIFCFLWGFGGAFVSLLLSRKMAKWTMRVQTVSPNETDPQLQQLYQLVDRIARQSQLPATPEVGIYESPEINAFATGASQKKSLVAVSTGLLHSLNETEREGVIAHEIAHIANGDMVTMALVQGVVNSFVMFFARIAAFFASQFFSSSEEGEGGGEVSPLLHFGLVILFDILFGILGSIVVFAFSRHREFRADSGAARLVGSGPMIAALERLKRNIEVPAMRDGFATMKISGKSTGLVSLFATHPSLDDRIARLKAG